MSAIAASISVLLAAAPAQLHSQTRPMMSGQVTVAIWGGGAARARAAQEEAFGVFKRIDEVMNEWRSDSPLSRINAAAGATEPVPAPADLCGVISRSLEAARATGGLFDPTWAALRGLWRFGTDAQSVVPSPAQVAERCALVAWEDVELTPMQGGACTVRLKRAGMQLGLGGVAKGYGVDEAVRKLRKRGLKNFYVQAGGDLYAAGTKGGKPWRVGIREPRGEASEHFASLELSNAAFSSSGDYERFFVKDGKRYHHLIDPRTCLPAEGTRAVTVRARSAIEAEFLTKAIFIKGGRDGLALAEELKVDAVIVTAGNEVLLTPGLKPALRWTQPRD